MALWFSLWLFGLVSGSLAWYLALWFGLWLFGLVYGSWVWFNLVWSLALWFGVWLFGLVCGSLVWSSNFVCVNENVYSVAWLALFCSAPIFFVVVYRASRAPIFFVVVQLLHILIRDSP